MHPNNYMFLEINFFCTLFNTHTQIGFYKLCYSSFQKILEGPALWCNGPTNNLHHQHPIWMVTGESSEFWWLHSSSFLLMCLERQRVDKASPVWTSTTCTEPSRSTVTFQQAILVLNCSNSKGMKGEEREKIKVMREMKMFQISGWFQSVVPSMSITLSTFHELIGHLGILVNYMVT